MDLFNLPLYSQLIAAFLSCWFFVKNKTLFLKYLTVFLVVTFLVELTGAYLTKLKIRNFWFYHYYTFFEFFAIFFLYKNLIKDKKYIKVSYVLLTVFVIIWFTTYIDAKYFYQAIVLGSVNVGVLVFLYLRELLLSDEIINYKKLLPFWVSVGFLVFFLPSIPFFSFWTYLKTRELIPILNTLIVLMNVIISFGLIWSNNKV